MMYQVSILSCIAFQCNCANFIHEDLVENFDEASKSEM